MIYRFGTFELDLAVVELRRGGDPVAVEPQVFAVLAYLIEHRDRMVSKDELISQIWDGRVVSDAALTSRIKSAREAVDDDGNRQQVIRTVRGRGFRFVGQVARPAAIDPLGPPADATGRITGDGSSDPLSDPATPDAAATPAAGATSKRPSIAILPFQSATDNATLTLLADALPHELITALARVRWLSVIARGSTFRFRESVDVLEVGQALNVRYCLTGIVQGTSRRPRLSVDLVDATDRSIIWSETLEFPIDDVHDTRETLIASIVAALEIQIPQHEARNARLRASESLDAWAQFHLGLAAMYRFNRHDNAAAEVHFRRALELDPGFGRAHAGLSFTSFQDAFLDYSNRIDDSIQKARRHAERAIELDPLDPFSNLNMGRALYLGGDFEPAMGWLDRSVDLSPSFAQARYCRGWLNTITGRGEPGRENIDIAMQLSPLDPLLYAMRASRSLSLMTTGDLPGAAEWADKGAISPGAHVLISMIAIAAHGLNDNDERASHWSADVKRRRPDATGTLFFQAFPFTDAGMRGQISNMFTKYGIAT